MKTSALAALAAMLLSLNSIFAAEKGQRAAPAARPALDHEVFYRHLRKAFRTPPGMKFTLKDLKPSAIRGFQTGLLEIGNGPQQVQPVHISNDGRFYVLSAAFRFKDSMIPGLRSAAAEAGSPEPPPVLLTADGSRFLLGQPQDMREDPDAANRAKMRLKGVPSRGPEDAPVTLVEFSDFQCPHCKKAHDILESELPAAFPGKVRVIFKNYPLTNIHPWAFEAAVAAACAGMKSGEAAHAMEVSFFAEQASIQKADIGKKALEFAQKAGLDAASFSACFDRQESKPLVEADMAEAATLGVNGTPALFVNGRRIQGYQFEAVRPVIEEMLADAAGK